MPKVILKKAVTLGRKEIYGPGDEIEVSEEIFEYLKKEDCIQNDLPKFPDLQVEVNPFEQIEAVDEKSQKLLVNNGIETLEDLINMDLKSIEDIHGISKKKAKEIFDSFEDFAQDVEDV